MSIILTNLGTYFIVSKVVREKVNENFKQEQIAKEKKEKNIATQKEKERLKKIKEQASFEINMDEIRNIDKVMFVAHPDDEALWAGYNMIKDDYLIVCFTNKSNKQRYTEFMKTMKKTNNVGIMLDYPDYTPGTKIKNDWKDCKDKIALDIEYVLSVKKWNKIVTHNPEGEYGHIQHRTVDFLVTNACVKNDLTGNLFYFEPYFSANYIKTTGLPPILTPEEAEMKSKLIFNDYSAQQAVFTFKHMISYETLVPYKDWYFINKSVK